MLENEGQTRKSRSASLLIILGTLWLLLALALLLYQFLSPAKVEITWETATEQNTVGFNLYRSDASDGEFALVNTDRFIPSEGSPVSGASYQYVDTSVVPDQTYYYVLEEIEADGSRIRYENDLFEYQVPGISWWLVVLIVVSTGVGIGMLIAGLQEKKKQ